MMFLSRLLFLDFCDFPKSNTKYISVPTAFVQTYSINFDLHEFTKFLIFVFFLNIWKNGSQQHVTSSIYIGFVYILFGSGENEAAAKSK